jgi:membrane protease YdiL (CAAX protease family)/NAD-dependent dihydropyrimidine dehydrogenase PreA subunit
MARSHARLKLTPDKCDRCDKCLEACKPNAIKIGMSYIYVDWRNCNGCYDCVKACDRDAIERRPDATRAKPAKRSRSTGEAKPKKTRAERKAEGKTAGKAKDTEAAKPAARAAGPWTLLEAAAMLAVVFAAFVAKDAALNSEWARSLSPSEAVTWRVGVLAIFYSVQIAALWGLARMRGVSFPEAFRLASFAESAAERAKSIGLVLGLLVASRALVLAYQVIARLAGREAPSRWNSNLTEVFGPEQAGFVLALLMVVVVAPVIEEIVFRGVLQGAFSARWGMWGGIAMASGLFAVYHFNAWMLFPTFVLGMAAGWLAATRESLWPAIWLHALFNAVPFVIAFWPI